MNTNESRAHARPKGSFVFSRSAWRAASGILTAIGVTSAIGVAGCGADPCILKGNCNDEAGAQASSGTGGGGGASSTSAGSGGKHADGPGAISGQVTDLKGAPILGAAVHVLDLPPVATDKSGVFAIDDLTPTDRLAVHVTAPGYADSVRVYDVTAGQTRSLSIHLLPRSAPVSIDAAMGGVIPFAAGGGVTLPPDSLINMEGEPLTGKVDVSLTYVDPTDTDQLNAAPGDYQAKMLDGTTSLLESWGMFELFIDDGKGRPARFVDGAVAEVEYPISMSSLKTAPGATPIFQFNRLTAMWEQQEAPAMQINAGSYSVKIPVGPFSGGPPGQPRLPYWNFDSAYPASCIRVKLLDKQGAIVVNERVFADGVTYSGTSDALTNDNGIACVPVKAGGQTVRLWSLRVHSGVNEMVVPPFTLNGTPATSFPFSAFASNACPMPCPLVATIHYNDP